MNRDHRSDSRTWPMLLLFAALAVRILGFTWGLPGPEHAWPYHPDESAALVSLSRMHPARLDLHPRQFVYGTAYVYSVGALLKAGQVAGLWSLDQAGLRRHPEQLSRIYLAGRLLSLIAGLVALWALYDGARRLWGGRAALFALALAAVAPTHCQLCRLFTVHSWAIMLVLLSFAASARHLADGRRCWLFASTVLAALAMASYLSAGMALLFALAALALRRPDHVWRDGAKIIVVFAGVFALAAPYVFLDVPFLLAFWREQKTTWYAVETWFSWRKLVNLGYGIGYIPLFLCLCGLTVIRRDRRAALLLAPLAIFYLLAMRVDTLFARHYLAGLMIALPLAGCWLDRRSAPVAAGLLTLAILWNLMPIGWDIARRESTDSRDRARTFLEKHCPHASVGIYSWFFVPHFDSKRHTVTRLHEVAPGATSPELIIGRGPELAVARQRFPEQRYHVIWSAPRPAPWGMPGEYVPEDWTYVSPEIIVERRAP